MDDLLNIDMETIMNDPVLLGGISMLGVTLLVIVAAGPYMMKKIIDFSERLIMNIPILIG